MGESLHLPESGTARFSLLEWGMRGVTTVNSREVEDLLAQFVVGRRRNAASPRAVLCAQPRRLTAALFKALRGGWEQTE